ncbi:MAG: hypothetical protein V4510_02825 [bacterium]
MSLSVSALVLSLLVLAIGVFMAPYTAAFGVVLMIVGLLGTVLCLVQLGGGMDGQSAVGPNDPAWVDASPESRLARLDDLRAKGIIPDAEWKSHRDSILDQL